MRRSTPVLTGLLFLAAVQAQETSFSYTNSGISTITNATFNSFTATNYTYASPTGQITLTSGNATITVNANATGLYPNATTSSNSQITRATTSPSLIEIGGSATSTATNGTARASSTSSSARPTNTTPCNGHPEFCNRKFSNITNVAAHNAAFVVKNNAASNQNLPILAQLNDGIRMCKFSPPWMPLIQNLPTEPPLPVQGETQYVNDTVYNCHTSCDLLNAGPWQDMLETAVAWLRANPYEVLSILIANSDLVTVDKYVPAITNSGILQYVWTPRYVPTYRDQWPTLGEMILRNERVVFFMDYNANQTAVPYILDQYTHLWETPWSPQNRSFPCTVDRPPNLPEEKARDQLMYLANHNLNQAVDVGAILGDPSIESILVPNTAELNITNSNNTGFGMLGAMTERCTAQWGHPPSFLVVDYYEVGSPEPPGSVFRAAAKANGVTYTKDCCGKDAGLTSAAGAGSPRASWLAGLVVLAMAVWGVIG